MTLEEFGYRVEKPTPSLELFADLTDLTPNAFYELGIRQHADLLLKAESAPQE